MEFTSFTQTILNNIREALGGDYTVFSQMIRKNNGVNRTGVIIKREGQSTYPTIYIDNFYKEGMTEEDIRKISDALLKEFKRAQIEEEVDLSGFIEFGQAKRKLAYKLISAEKNKELLRTVPHRIFHDLALVFYYTLQEPPFYGKAAILVHNHHMEQWESTPEELFTLAFANTPALFPGVIDSMERVMQEILAESSGRKKSSGNRAWGEEEERAEGKLSDENWLNDLLEQMAGDLNEEKIPMYVLTNTQKLYGAACMLYPGVIKGFAEKMGSDFYLLPSSVHEVILVPAGAGADQEALKEIVTDINRTQVAADEVLSDSVYYYSRSRDKILWLL